MTFEAAIIVSAFILVTTAVVLIIVVSGRRAAAKEEEMRRQASMRGWAYEKVREGASRVQRWTGTTDGIAWIAESIVQLKGTHGRGASDRRTITRWRTASAPGPAAPIVCMGLKNGSESPSFSIAQGDSWLAKMAQKVAGFAFDKAVDVYFGKALGDLVDAAALRRVEGASIHGFIVMAADTNAASRLLFQGLSTALADGTHNPHSILSDKDRPWVLLWSGGVALARMAQVHSVEELERFAHAGVALTRVPTFGRPSPS
jgi:hypothetical protein